MHHPHHHLPAPGALSVSRMAQAVAAALALYVSGCGLAVAQDAGAGLKEVVVTATGFEQEVVDAPASITVISQEELKKRPFRDLTDALRDVEGVTITGTASEKDIFIRGLPGAYTLILVDGKRQSTRDARTNGNSGFEQSYIPPLEAIERIEVVRGPMSSLYGSDAMGGVINIITKKVARQWGGSLSVDTTLQQHGDSGDAWRAASRRFSVPTAFVSKSSNGIAAARSWLGCAAVCTMTAGFTSRTSASTPARSRMSTS